MRIGKSGQGLGSLLLSDLPKSSPERKAAAKAEQEVQELAQERADAPEQSQEDLRVALGKEVDTSEPEAEAEDSDDEEYVDVPSKADPKADWVDFAVSQGMDREEAEGLTKQDLIDEFGG